MNKRYPTAEKIIQDLEDPQDGVLNYPEAAYCMAQEIRDLKARLQAVESAMDSLLASPDPLA